MYKFYPWETCAIFAEFAKMKSVFFSEHVRFSLNFSELLGNLQILPMENVRHFRRIHNNGAPFLKTCVFFTEFTEMIIVRRN